MARPRVAPPRRAAARRPAWQLALLLAALALGPALAAAAADKWTFFVYMIADNDLECFAINDMLVGAHAAWGRGALLLARRPRLRLAMRSAPARRLRTRQPTPPHNAPRAPQEMMRGLAREPPAGCTTAACGAPCPDGAAAVSQAACGGGGRRLRCCPADAYPDVFMWADRGVSPCFVDAHAAAGLDATLLAASWSNVRELQLLPGARRRRGAARPHGRGGLHAHGPPPRVHAPCMGPASETARAPCARQPTAPPPPPTALLYFAGGKWQQRTSYPELDMARPDTLADFLRAGLAAFPPAPGRRHALVFWDHGAGWAGYGVDSTCSPVKPYSEKGCDMLTLDTLSQGGRGPGRQRSCGAAEPGVANAAAS
jgi:hypothetical protein